MTNSPKPSGSVPQIVAEIASRVSIKALSLVHAECAVVDVKEGDVVDQLKMSLRGGGKKHDIPSTLLCSFGLSVDAQAKDPAGKIIARFVCDYALQYEVRDEEFFRSLTDEQVEMFAAYNAVFNAWPHARELVQSMSGRMMLPPIILPLFRPAEMIPTRENWQTVSKPS